MGAFEKAMARLAALPDDALARPWRWRGKEAHLRYALYRSLEEEHEALAAALVAWRPTEAERILAISRRSFGELRGLLVALPDTVLDDARDGDWSLRDVLRHALLVERRYAVNTAYAAHRREDEPLRLEAGDPRYPSERDVDASGGLERVLERFAAARDQSDALLGALPAARLERPSTWSGHEVDVRFRLHRFASHLAEHTIQCEKALEAWGWRSGEARRIVRRIWAARGELEATGDDAAMAALDAAHSERAATLPQAGAAA